MTTTQKKIMVVSYNHNLSQRLKSELELRKVCDFVDINLVGSDSKKLLEELVLKKDSGQYNDYKLYIIDDSIKEDGAYDFAENVKHNYPTAHFVLLSAGGKPATLENILFFTP